MTYKYIPTDNKIFCNHCKKRISKDRYPQHITTKGYKKYLKTAIITVLNTAFKHLYLTGPTTVHKLKPPTFIFTENKPTEQYKLKPSTFIFTEK